MWCPLIHSMILCSYLKYPSRGWRDGSVVKTAYCSCRDLGSVPSTWPAWLTTAHGFSFRDSNAFFSPSCVPVCTQYTWTHIDAHICTLKKVLFKLAWVANSGVVGLFWNLHQPTKYLPFLILRVPLLVGKAYLLVVRCKWRAWVMAEQINSLLCHLEEWSLNS